MAYSKSKDLAKRSQSDNVLKDEAFNISSDPKYDGYPRGLASMVHKLFDKKYIESGVDTEPNYQLTNKLNRQIIRKFKKVYLFKMSVDLADMQSLSKYNKGSKYLLCSIGLFSKYTWVVVPLKDKRGINIANAFQKKILKRTQIK